MKKFMFAAIAAMVMVSVSNVFASSRMFSNAQVAPVDTVAPNGAILLLTEFSTLSKGADLKALAKFTYTKRPNLK